MICPPLKIILSFCVCLCVCVCHTTLCLLLSLLTVEPREHRRLEKSRKIPSTSVSESRASPTLSPRVVVGVVVVEVGVGEPREEPVWLGEREGEERRQGEWGGPWRSDCRWSSPQVASELRLPKLSTNNRESGSRCGCSEGMSPAAGTLTIG